MPRRSTRDGALQLLHAQADNAQLQRLILLQGVRDHRGQLVPRHDVLLLLLLWPMLLLELLPLLLLTALTLTTSAASGQQRRQAAV